MKKKELKKKQFAAYRFIKDSPSLIIFLSFLGIILAGAILLTLPISTASHTWNNPLTALFSASSATCVTGLVVVDTGTFYSKFGQLIILLLIQIGGLGYMAVATMFFLFLGQAVSLKHRITLKESLSFKSVGGVVRFAKLVLFTVFTVESIGALFLFFIFLRDFSVKESIEKAVFHSISAFCNAGFDIMENFTSFTKYVGNLYLNIIITTLIIIGGIGFVVIWEILHREKDKKTSIHTKAVVFMTVFLIIFGTIFILVLDYNNPKTLGSIPFFKKVLASYFQSVTARTAGFNTLDIGSLTTPSLLVLIFLMFVGGSPGGTAGGIKTTTFLLLVVFVISIIKGKENTVLMKREIKSSVMRKTFLIFLIALFIVTVSVFLLTITEGSKFSLLEIIFEVVSAFGTVGLSMGITTKLSDFGKIVIILTMFSGRVGILSLIYGLLSLGRVKIEVLKYPEDTLSVG